MDFETINEYLNSIGIYSKQERENLYNRYCSCQGEYLEAINNFFEFDKLPSFVFDEVEFLDVYIAQNKNIISSVCVFKDLKESPVLADFILGGINVVKKRKNR